MWHAYTKRNADDYLKLQIQMSVLYLFTLLYECLACMYVCVLHA